MKLDTEYIAGVDTGEVVHSIHFKFSIVQNLNCVTIKDACKGAWCNHYYGDGAHVFHVTADGTWEMHAPLGCSAVWRFQRNDGCRFTPIVYEVEYAPTTASTKIEDRKEGDNMSPYEPEIREYSPMADEPRIATGYEPETVYEALVTVENVTHSIYFMFSHRTGVNRVNIRRVSGNSDWCGYYIDTATAVKYYVPLGTWIMRVHVGCNPDWLFQTKKDGALHVPTIAKAWGIKHSDEEKDDMVDAFGYAMTEKKDVDKEVKQVIDWHKRQRMWHDACQAEARQTKKKEVKKEMYLQLIEVIFFNRKTKEVDLKKNIVAKDPEDAYMLAAQDFGKFDPKVHVKTQRCVLGFSEFGDKNCEEDE